jgi:hypothetical protein
MLMRGYTARYGVSKRWTWAEVGTLDVDVGSCIFGPPSAQLRFVHTGRREPTPVIQQVALVPTWPHFGGVAWAFVCPISGNRCRRLILPRNGNLWASRRGLGLDYASQRETERARAIRRYVRLERKLVEGKINRQGRRVRLQKKTIARLSRASAIAWRQVEVMM